MAFLFARFPSYGAAGQLARAIDTYWEPTISLFLIRDQNTDFHTLCPSQTFYQDQMKLQSLEQFLKEDLWIFVGVSAISYFIKLMNAHRGYLKENIAKKTIVVIVTDSPIIRKQRENLSFIQRLNPIVIFAMPDLFPYLQDRVNCPIYPFYQPVELIGPYKFSTKAHSTNQLFLCHAPNTKAFYKNVKGTAEIDMMFQKIKNKYSNLKLTYEIIPATNRLDALKQKSKASIFVDQIIYKNPNCWVRGGKQYYYGGLGKSGLEMMFFNTAVITSGNIEKITEASLPDIPPPPVRWVNYYNFQEALEELIVDKNIRNKQIQEQQAWADKYLRMEFVANYLKTKIQLAKESRPCV